MEITMDIQVGSTITNGSSALRVDRRVDRHLTWNAPGWEGVVIALEEFASRGVRNFIPDYLAASWRHVPFEWVPVPGARDLEERYVWSRGYQYLQREVRRIERPAPTYPGKACDEAETEGHEPHLWQELHIPTGNPLVEHTQWWQCGEVKA